MCTEIDTTPYEDALKRIIIEDLVETRSHKFTLLSNFLNTKERREEAQGHNQLLFK